MRSKNMAIGAGVALLLAVATVYGIGQYSAEAARPASSGAEKDIVETAVAAGQFSTLATALGEADLVDALKGEGPFTVFAPTDEAFGKLPDGTIEALLADKEKLTAVLTYHVVPGRVTAKDVMKIRSAETLQGQAIHVKSCCASGTVQINDAKVVKADIHASNGVIHVIDSVLLPPQ
jgi:uncharacterized surface protein with fasciclin (FAS1) repeats